MNWTIFLVGIMNAAWCGDPCYGDDHRHQARADEVQMTFSPLLVIGVLAVVAVIDWMTGGFPKLDIDGDDE